MLKNPKILIAIIVIIAILGVGAYALAQNSTQSDEAMNVNEDMMQKDESSMQPSDKTMDNAMADSSYVQYSKSALDNAASGRRVLFFYASWCPTCRPADESFLQNADKIPDDLTLIRVNYNDPETDQEEKDLAKKYGVTYQHTFVQIDSSGQPVAKWNGGQIEKLLSNIK